jgi:hypothetical protein
MSPYMRAYEAGIKLARVEHFNKYADGPEGFAIEEAPEQLSLDEYMDQEASASPMSRSLYSNLPSVLGGGNYKDDFEQYNQDQAAAYDERAKDQADQGYGDKLTREEYDAAYRSASPMSRAWYSNAPAILGGGDPTQDYQDYLGRREDLRATEPENDPYADMSYADMLDPGGDVRGVFNNLPSGGTSAPVAPAPAPAQETSPGMSQEDATQTYSEQVQSIDSSFRELGSPETWTPEQTKTYQRSMAVAADNYRKNLGEGGALETQVAPSPQTPAEQDVTDTPAPAPVDPAPAPAPVDPAPAPALTAPVAPALTAPVVPAPRQQANTQFTDADRANIEARNRDLGMPTLDGQSQEALDYMNAHPQQQPQQAPQQQAPQQQAPAQRYRIQGPDAGDDPSQARFNVQAGGYGKQFRRFKEQFGGADSTEAFKGLNYKDFASALGNRGLQVGDSMNASNVMQRLQSMRRDNDNRDQGMPLAARPQYEQLGIENRRNRDANREPMVNTQLKANAPLVPNFKPLTTGQGSGFQANEPNLGNYQLQPRPVGQGYTPPKNYNPLAGPTPGDQSSSLAGPTPGDQSNTLNSMGAKPNTTTYSGNMPKADANNMMANSKRRLSNHDRATLPDPFAD